MSPFYMVSMSCALIFNEYYATINKVIRVRLFGAQTKMSGYFGSNEKLQELRNLPSVNRSLQVPVVMRSGSDLYLYYYIAPSESDWRSTFANDPVETIRQQSHAIVRCHGVLYFSSDTFEDDTVSAHRFSKLGLQLFKHYEVDGSVLVEEIRFRQKSSKIHRYGCPKLLHHFVFALPGSIVEAVASGLDVKVGHGPVPSSICPLELPQTDRCPVADGGPTVLRRNPI